MARRVVSFNNFQPSITLSISLHLISGCVDVSTCHTDCIADYIGRKRATMLTRLAEWAAYTLVCWFAKELLVAGAYAV